MLLLSPWRRRVAALLCAVFTLWLTPLGAQPVAPAACPSPAPQWTTAQMAEALRTAPDLGFLWRLTQGGRTSWLYGTLHVARPEWTVPGPQVRAAMGASDVLALELDPTDPQTLAELMAPPSAAVLAARAPLTAAQQRQIAALARAQCVPAALLVGMSPLMQGATLTVLSGRADGFYPEMALDAMLSAWAQARKMPVVALESAAAQRDLLEQVGDSAQAQSDSLDAQLADLTSGSAREQLAKVANAWARSDLPLFERYPEWCDCMTTDAERRTMARLLDDRNLPLAQRIAALHTGGQRVFAGIGALHMVGPTSVVRHLQDLGFVVTPVAFKP